MAVPVLLLLCLSSITAVPRVFTSGSAPVTGGAKQLDSGKVRPIIFMHGVLNDEKELDFANQYIPKVTCFQSYMS